MNGGAEAVPVAGGTGEVVNKVGIGVEAFSAEDFADGGAVGAGKTNDALSLLEGEIFDEVEPAGTVGEGESFWVFVERCERIEPVARVRAALSEFVEFDNEGVEVGIAVDVAAEIVSEIAEGGVVGGVIFFKQIFDNVLLEKGEFVLVSVAEFWVEINFGEMALENGQAKCVERHNRSAA